MRKISAATFVALAFAGANAIAGTSEAYVMPMKPPIDGVIKNASMLYMLEPKIACPLAIANHANMRLAFIFNPAFKKPVIGCWARTNDPSGAEAVVVGNDGTFLPSVNLMNLYRVDVLDNGDGRVLGPLMTEDERQKNIAAYKQQFRQP
ncbi:MULTISPECIES: hypothetical protein [unclassified Burkholderia]|uniref:hypothetical protein n=1 Tax=unclassified Burkholderia TaxID=2613784 RepID=UPI000FB0AFE6|nr:MULTISPECIES: hypothetical protein [unclassified Burkholderia]RQZ37661.1 hypothetical protein DIE13_01020 [Burkholderia sp. Bp9016]